MKKIILLNLILSAFVVSCQNKSQDVNETLENQIDAMSVVLNETILATNSDSIDYLSLPRMTRAVYDSLQLSNVEGLVDYDTTYLSMGQILLSNAVGKLITIQVITDGEITEYLVSYDKDGNLQDNLLVAYEDMVEYYSQVSSLVKMGEVAVQTVNFTYDDNDNESSDTVTAIYEITPELKFIALSK